MGSHKSVTRANAHAPGEVADYVDFAEVAAPATPATGFVRAYAKTDGILYMKDDAGTETAFGGGGGGTVQTAKATRQSTAQAIPNTTFTAVSFDTEVWDTDTMVDIAGAPTRITVKTAGKYRVTAGVIFAFNATGIRIVDINKNGTAIAESNHPTPGNFGYATTNSVEADMAINDYFTVSVYQSSGGSLNLAASALNFLSVTRIDP